jgi:hypothetical protein
MTWKAPILWGVVVPLTRPRARRLDYTTSELRARKCTEKVGNITHSRRVFALAMQANPSSSVTRSAICPIFKLLAPSSLTCSLTDGAGYRGRCHPKQGRRSDGWQ